MQLAHARHIGLDVDGRLFRIDADREIVHYQVATELARGGDVIAFDVARQRVVIRNQQKDLILILQTHPVRERSDVVTEVQRTGRSIPRENSFLGCHVFTFPF